MTTIDIELTPMERLHLRELLQDNWREQVRLITELSLELHSPFDSDEDIADETAIAVALSHARLRLEEIEQAMRRLDDHSYGHCVACGVSVSFIDLVAEPDTRYCGECLGNVLRRSSAAHSG